MLPLLHFAVCNLMHTFRDLDLYIYVIEMGGFFLVQPENWPILSQDMLTVLVLTVLFQGFLGSFFC